MIHSKARKLGQHMLTSKRTAERIVDSAEIGENDSVLEIGTGQGILTCMLSQISHQVVSYEIDKELFASSASALSSPKNLKIVLGDAFKSTNIPQFDVCVTSLPYSQSVRFIKWLALRSGTFRSAAAVVQSEFASKLCSEASRSSYRAVSVLAQLSFDIERLFEIERDEFRPRPKVRSAVVRFRPRKDIRQPFFNQQRIASLNYLFSFRRKLVARALKGIMGKEQSLKIDGNILLKRVESLSPEEFAFIIRELDN